MAGGRGPIEPVYLAKCGGFTDIPLVILNDKAAKLLSRSKRNILGFPKETFLCNPCSLMGQGKYIHFMPVEVSGVTGCRGCRIPCLLLVFEDKAGMVIPYVDDRVFFLMLAGKLRLPYLQR